jgi:hypothetical protein
MREIIAVASMLFFLAITGSQAGQNWVVGTCELGDIFQTAIGCAAAP